MPIKAGEKHTVTNNLLAQRKNPNRAGYYGALFVNGLADAVGVPADYRGVAGGKIEQMGAGVRL